jgi:hypothetical protein
VTPEHNKRLQLTYTQRLEQAITCNPSGGHLSGRISASGAHHCKRCCTLRSAAVWVGQQAGCAPAEALQLCRRQLPLLLVIIVLLLCAVDHAQQAACTQAVCCCPAVVLRLGGWVCRRLVGPIDAEPTCTVLNC